MADLHTDGWLPDDAVQLLQRDFDRTTVRALRHEVRACVAAIGVTGTAAAKLVLAVHEVVVNAVRHGGGRGRLQLWSGGEELWCRITDDGPGIAPPRRALLRQPRSGQILSTSELLLGGAGLWLAARICATVRIHDGAGTVVLLRYPLPSTGG